MVITWGIQLVLSYNRFLIKLIKFYHPLFYLNFINWCCQRNMPYCKLHFKGSIMVLYKRYTMLYSEGLCFSSKCFSVCNLPAVTYPNQNCLLNRKRLIIYNSGFNVLSNMIFNNINAHMCFEKIKNERQLTWEDFLCKQWLKNRKN